MVAIFEYVARCVMALLAHSSIWAMPAGTVSLSDSSIGHLRPDAPPLSMKLVLPTRSVLSIHHWPLHASRQYVS